MKYDLLIKGGSVLLDSGDLVECDVAVRDGRIAALGTELGEAARTVDASGKIVAPGAVDPHVHFGNTMPFDDEMAIDSGSALLGGVTSIGCFLRSKEPYSRELPQLIESVQARSRVDVFFHLQMFNTAQIDDMKTCADQYGIDSFKFYLSGIPGIVDSVDEATLLQGMREAHRVSDSAVVAVHCENAALVQSAHLEANVFADKNELPLESWERRHPALAEVVAIETSAALAKEAGVRLYVVHISSAAGLDHVRQLRLIGNDIVGETTSIYLTAQSDDRNGLLVKQAPPIRDSANREALWQGVIDGTIETIGTDNTARSLESKNPAGGIDGSKPGLPMLGTHVAVMLDEGVHQRGLPFAQVWHHLSRRPAEVFGLFPQKGSTRPGADADLVVIDLDVEREVVPAQLGSFSDFSPLQGRVLRGWPVVTVKAGVVAAENGAITEWSAGKYLPRQISRSRE